VATTRLVQGSQLPALPVGGRMGCAVTTCTRCGHTRNLNTGIDAYRVGERG